MNDQMDDAAQSATDAQDPGSLLTAREPPGPSRRMLTHFFGHFVICVGVFAIWAAADAWQQVTQLGAAAFLSVSTAILAGATIAALIHEWGHYVGARWSGSTYTGVEQFGLFVFNFDYSKNNPHQFDVMSWAGQAGGWLAVILLWLAVPMDSAGRVMLVCSAIGHTVFTAVFEWPVILHARNSRDPQLELSRITREDIYRYEAIGAGSAILLWLIAV